MNRRSFWAGLTLLLMLPALAPLTANAGSQQGDVNSEFKKEFDQQQLFAFSKQVERAAAAQGAKVFLLARLGRASADLPKGIEFTHTGIAVYSMITTADGQSQPGYAIYNLYQQNQDPARSELVIDYPADFFAGASQLKAGIVIPDKALQQRLLAQIQAGGLKSLEVLHNDRYSTLANPFNSQFQNCTEFVLDVINAAIYQTRDIKQLKANSKAHFSGQKVNIGGFALTMAAWMMDDLSLADHDGKVTTATFSTIRQYLKNNELLKFEQILLPDTESE
ncbi:MAG: hypothetical protein ACI8WB_005158 [Phenylobacterium sp.]|jgi:hypothetical protein